MTDSSRKAQEQAERMRDWYKEREIPKTIRFGSHEQLLNTALYVKTALDTLNHSTVNSNHFRAAYFRLWRLKKHLEQQ